MAFHLYVDSDQFPMIIEAPSPVEALEKGDAMMEKEAKARFPDRSIGYVDSSYEDGEDAEMRLEELKEARSAAHGEGYVR
jgi:hypothetical protein